MLWNKASIAEHFKGRIDPSLRWV